MGSQGVGSERSSWYERTSVGRFAIPAMTDSLSHQGAARFRSLRGMSGSRALFLFCGVCFMNRRQFLIGSGVATAAMAGGITLRRLTQSPADIPGLMAELEALRGRTLKAAEGWSPFKVLSHLAQSIELSMSGYPELKSPLFRHTAGATAFLVFASAGAMRHPLTEPIPGAPALDENGDTDAALNRLLTALINFSAHQGPLAPHFAYGELSKDDYAHAHLMHVRDHFRYVSVI